MSDLNRSGEPVDPRRLVVLSAVFSLLFLWYSGYLLYLQLVKGVEFKAKAAGISRQTTVIPAQRGEIYDRTMSIPLVLNNESFAVDLIPAELPAALRDTFFSKLALILDRQQDDLRKRISPSEYHLYQAIEIAESVPYDKVASIAERIDEFPGVAWHVKPKRNYLETGSIAHVIGYVGNITREEYKVLYNKGYGTGDVIGKSGIEKQYDSILRGKDGREYRTVDVKGRKILQSDRMIDPPIPGQNIVLTIDRKIQLVAEKALGPRMGSVVVLKPATGEVLAMVSYPWYNPNLFGDVNASKEYLQILNDPNTPLLNRTIQSSYPPASTFKAVMATGILGEGKFPAEKKVLCPGEISYGDRIFRCWIKRPGHGYLDLRGAIAQSCDVYFWTVMRDYVGIERMVSYARDFGLGQISGIDLPGELSGFVPTPKWKENKFHERWLGGDTMNMSIGQGYMLVTPLQLANVYALIVNGGVVYKPHVLKEVRDAANGALVKRVVPEALFTAPFDKEDIRLVRSYLREVVTTGTARYSAPAKAVQVAGKTGTAEVGLADRWHSWFVGFGPYDAKDPEDVIVVVVMTEASNPWEWWTPFASAIIFQSVFADQTFEEAVDALGISNAAIERRNKVE
ncbi:MAG: penicillin-binding protein 2 [Spirochaetes bacterium]|nr:penicillin-binding protein 2 [Spirochaetota bacterium]